MSGNEKHTGADKLIDQNLKRVFQEALDEDLPDRFLDLLNKLKDETPRAGEGRNEKS